MPGVKDLTTDKTSTRSNTRFLKGTDDFNKEVPAVLFKGASDAEWGSIKAGTIAGKRTSDGKYVPCGVAETTGTSSSATQTMTDASMLRVGDSGDLVHGSDVLGTATIDADGAGNLIELEEVTAEGLEHGVTLTDPSANDQLIDTQVTIDADGTYHCDVLLATGGAGAITSTVADVIAAINAAISHKVEAKLASGDSGSGTAVAVAETTLSGGQKEGGAISSGLTINTISGNDVTFDSSVTPTSGARFHRDDGTDVPVGFFAEDATTIKSHDENREPVHGDGPMQLLIRGHIDWDHVKGADSGDYLKGELDDTGWFLIDN